MEKVSKRLVEAMERIDITQSELAKRANINKGALSSYLSGRYEPKQKAIYKLAEALNVDEAWLMGYDVNMKREIQNELTSIPDKNIIFDDYFPLHYCTNLSAGTLEELLEAEPDAIVYVPIKYQMMKKRLHAFKVNGDSMDNIIEDGSIVIAEDVKHLSRIKDGTIVVAWCNGEATVKRLYYNDIQITLMPDSSNKVHKPILINTEIDTVHIIGRVIWHMNPDDMEERY